jgi:uncharacterized membrane protein
MLVGEWTMGKYINTNSGNNNAPSSRYRSVRRRRKEGDTEIRVVKIISIGAIISGALSCLASVSIGLSLVLLGTIVFSEL